MLDRHDSDQPVAKGCKRPPAISYGPGDDEDERENIYVCHTHVYSSSYSRMTDNASMGVRDSRSSRIEHAERVSALHYTLSLTLGPSYDTHIRRVAVR